MPLGSPDTSIRSISRRREGCRVSLRRPPSDLSAFRFTLWADWHILLLRLLFGISERPLLDSFRGFLSRSAFHFTLWADWAILLLRLLFEIRERPHPASFRGCLSRRDRYSDRLDILPLLGVRLRVFLVRHLFDFISSLYRAGVLGASVRSSTPDSDPGGGAPEHSRSESLIVPEDADSGTRCVSFSLSAFTPTVDSLDWYLAPAPAATRALHR